MIEMTAEDVLIEIFPGGNASITAAFLFTNTGAADTVIMYFPLVVRTLTMGPALPLIDITDPLRAPSVSINGSYIEVHPMIGNTWLPEYNEYRWEDIRSEVMTMTETEPDMGEVYFYTVEAENWHSYDYIDLIYDHYDEITFVEELQLLCNSLNASWIVPFSAGEEVLVEFCIEYTMSSEYENPYCTMIYPLYTGASWTGSIGEGRITAVPAGGLKFSDFHSWYSVSMPDAEIVEGLAYVPLSEISDCVSFANTELADFSGTHFDSALVWIFTDFEPVVSPTHWQFFYYSPDNPDYRFHSGSAGVDTTDWSSSLRIDILDPLWVN